MFLKEHIDFKTLEDELIQRNLLLEKEREDYVCKDTSTHYREERFLKLIIRKRRCKEFVALMHEMHCYRFISETILEFQQGNANNPQMSLMGIFMIFKE